MVIVELRRGITRTVLLTRRWAVKVPSLRAHGGGLPGVLWSLSRGIQANLSEVEWSQYSGETGDPICPARWSLLGGVVVIYPRCQPVPVDAAGEPLAPYPERPFGVPGDPKAANLGIYQGRVVWLDYDVSFNGCPHDRAGRYAYGSGVAAAPDSRKSGAAALSRQRPTPLAR